MEKVKWHEQFDKQFLTKRSEDGFIYELIEPDKLKSFISTEIIEKDRNRISAYVGELGEREGWTLEVMTELMRIINDEPL